MSSFSVLKVLRFAYGHRIAGHGGPCALLHGHNARVEIRCRGKLDPLGMVVDFAEIRERISAWIRDHWDHRMILQRDDPLIPVLREHGQRVFELDGPPTAENLAAHLWRVAKTAGLPVVAVRFWETETSCATFEEA